MMGSKSILLLYITVGCTMELAVILKGQMTLGNNDVIGIIKVHVKEYTIK